MMIHYNLRFVKIKAIVNGKENFLHILENVCVNDIEFFEVLLKVQLLHIKMFIDLCVDLQLINQYCLKVLQVVVNRALLLL